ncbi:MAG: glycosyltransferase family 2 protein [bacterium]|nr:glycosyltransferase family 2 protein [bacterium]
MPEKTTPYQLTVIVVNYNVEYFLDQCLQSVRKASDGLKIEVIVVDNASRDGSVEMLAQKYSDFHLILNEDNVGFSKANNQGIDIALGKYVLLLNPDTVVEESGFRKVIDYMDAHPEAGGLGVRMIDGRGNFLPESKRGLPKPMVAFYKIFGLSRIFPKSKRFGQYHLGHLSEFETAEIDILSGAFMLMRKEALDKVGALDESFFMYGEDIDLSYRIQKGGYKNVYFPETTIIHYKGESTKKSSVNYVFVFYRAMVIFAKKHFSGNNAWLFSFLINMAIYFRASLAIFTRLIKTLFLPLFDLTCIVLGLFALTNYWSMSNIEFPDELIRYSIPAYGITWVAVVYFNGGYDRPIKLFKYLKGTILGTLPILVAYAILPKSLQFSRLFIFIGAAWVMIYYFVSRIYFHFAFPKWFRLRNTTKKNFAIYGSDVEFERISHLLSQTQTNIGEVKKVSKEELADETLKVDELIFSAKDISNEEIIALMSKLKSNDLDFKIAPEASDLLIGSNSIDTAGELYILNLNALISSENKRKKRLFDLMAAFGMMLSLPVSIFLFKNKATYVQNVFSVLVGKKSFIGFSEELSFKDVRLPRIKKGILTPDDGFEFHDEGITEKLNLLYARDYSMRKDFSIVWKAWRKLDS